MLVFHRNKRRRHVGSGLFDWISANKELISNTANVIGNTASAIGNIANAGASTANVVKQIMEVVKAKRALSKPIEKELSQKSIDFLKQLASSPITGSGFKTVGT
jgi:hypothetical protein